jgi:Prokaryotic lipoprotein-attachment site
MGMRQQKPLTILALALAAALAGCGVKSAPIAPELVRPERITDLVASADATGIKLTWQRPTHYAGGRQMRDLGSFVILRGPAMGVLEPLTEIPVTDRERFSVQREFTYIDTATNLNSRYHYQIVSKTVDGYVSEPSNEVDFKRIKPVLPPNPENFRLPASPASPGPPS